ncbi:MAG: hypothetical protein AAF441_16875 [Pseudomonadota bacterium]
MKFVLAIAVAAMAAGLAHTTLWQFRRHRPGRLVYPRYYLVLAVLCTVFFATLELISLVADAASTSKIAHFWFVSLAIVGLAVILGYFFEFYELSDEGLRFQRLFRPDKTVLWSDVKALEYSRRYGTFDVGSSQGVSISVPPMMTGSDEFAAAALRQAPPEAINEDTRKALEAAARGDSP